MAFTMALSSSILIDTSLQVMSTVFSGVLSSIEHCALVLDYTFNGIDRALCSLSPFWLPIEHCALVFGRLLRRIEHYVLPFGVTSHPWSSIMLPYVVYCRRSIFATSNLQTCRSSLQQGAARYRVTTDCDSSRRPIARPPVCCQVQDQ
jgi:hypothetical protein